MGETLALLESCSLMLVPSVGLMGLGLCLLLIRFDLE